MSYGKPQKPGFGRWWGWRARMYRKQIVYDRMTKDFAMYLDGELVGYARTFLEAEVTLDQLVYELLSAGYFPKSA